MAKDNGRKNQIIADKPMSAFDSLKKRQAAFVVAYLNHFNASRAAREAGYSTKFARQSGYQLLTNIDIQAAIQEELECRGITSDKIEVAFAEIAFDADLADFEPWLRKQKTLAQLKHVIDLFTLHGLLALAKSI